MLQSWHPHEYSHSQTAMYFFSIPLNVQFELFVDLLGITPAYNNGTHGSLNHLLKNPVYVPRHPEEESHPSVYPLLKTTSSLDIGCSCDLAVSNSDG